MGAPDQSGHRMQFGVFEADFREGKLRRHGRLVNIQSQPFRILAALLEHPGKLVGRAELYQKLWPDHTFVDFDRGLNKAMNKLRRALGDSAESPRFIETVPRRGYRFIAPIIICEDAAGEESIAHAQPGPASEATAFGPSPENARQTTLPPAVACDFLGGRETGDWHVWKIFAAVAIVLIAALATFTYVGGGPQTSSARLSSPRISASAFSNLSALPDVAALYSEGLVRLRRFDAGGARDLFQKAVAAAPTNGLAHSALAAAWSALGYDGKAQAEASEAVRQSAGLTHEQRLLVEARCAVVERQWPTALEAYRTLFSLFPENVDYGLGLADAETRAGDGSGALATLESVRSISPPMRADSRVELAEAAAAETLGRFNQVLVAAGSAAAAAKAEGAPGLLARALNLEAWGLENTGRLNSAATLARESRRLSRATGDEADLATSNTLEAIALDDRGDLSAARSMFSQALAVYRQMGSEGGIAAELNDLGAVDSALGNLASAREQFEDSLALYRDEGHQDGVALTESNLGDTLLDLGFPAQAARMYEASLEICRATGDQSKAAGDIAGLGRVHRAEGDLEGARDYLARAAEIYGETGEQPSAASSKLDLAEVLLEEGDARLAAALAQNAANELNKVNGIESESLAYGILARALLSEGSADRAALAMERADALFGKSRNRSIGLYLAVTKARLRAASGGSAERGQAIHGLMAARSQAVRAGFVIDEFEARLALVEIEMSVGNARGARAKLEAVKRDAAARGLGLIVQQASAMLAPRQMSAPSPLPRTKTDSSNSNLPQG